MPSRSQVRIRRDLNRLQELIEDTAAKQPALAAIRADVASATQLINDRWQNYQSASVIQDKEMQERDAATAHVQSWIQRWRPVVLLKVPGAATNLRALPSRGATTDDQLRVAEDLKTFIQQNPAAESFREPSISALGNGIDDAQREHSESVSAVVAQDGARAALTEASISANAVLTRGVEIVRAVFGPRSPEARQFRLRTPARSEEDTGALEREEDAESEVGES